MTERRIDTELINKIAMWGLILGVVMSCSRIYEIKTLVSGDLNSYLTMTVEWFVVMAIYVYILFKANKQRAAEMPAEVGYRFGQSLNYSMIIAVFAGVIVGITSHIYINNVVGGYDQYAELSYQSIVSIIEDSGVEYDDVASVVEQNMSSIEEIAKNPPSLFSWVMSSVASYIMSSLFIGLFVAGVTRRRAKIVDNE